MATIHRFVPLALAAAALCATLTLPAAAQSMDPAKWVLIQFDNVYMDTSTIAPAEGGGQRVWIRALFEGEQEWPRHPEVKYNALYYERVYRCDTFEWVTLRHQAYLDQRMVRDIPNILAGHMNNGRDNQEDVFRIVCEHIRARGRG
jgi:hypothetical protein